jgi:hypothetical protein
MFGVARSGWCISHAGKRVDQWRTPALPNQMVELRQQSPLGAPVCMRRSMGRLRLWARCAALMATCRIQLTAGECGAGVPARPVRFRRHAHRLGWSGGDPVCSRGTEMSTEDRKALVHRLVAASSRRTWHSDLVRLRGPTPVHPGRSPAASLVRSSCGTVHGGSGSRPRSIQARTAKRVTPHTAAACRAELINSSFPLTRG